MDESETEDEARVIVGEAELSAADFAAAWRWVPIFRRLRFFAMAMPFMWVVLLVTSLADGQTKFTLSDMLPALIPGTVFAVLCLAFLRLGPETLLLVPKRAFQAAELPALRELLQRRAPTKPQSNRPRKLLLIWVVALVAFLSIWQFLSMDQPREREIRDEQMRDEGRRQ